AYPDTTPCRLSNYRRARWLQVLISRCLAGCMDLVASIWTEISPEEAVMKGVRSSSPAHTFAGFAVFSLIFALGMQPLAQTPRSLMAMGSYAQQPQVKGIEEAPHFALSPEMQGDIMMAHQRYIAALDLYRQSPVDSPIVWNKMGIANHHMFNLRE